MTTHEQDSERPPIDGGEMMFLLLKHRWKLILCAVAGLAAGAFVYLHHQPPFQSEAKLLVRYVVDRSVVDPLDPKASTTNAGRNTDGIISSESEILTSWDLALEVAEAVGADRLLGVSSAEANTSNAAKMIRDNLIVTGAKGSSVLSVSFRNDDPEVAVAVLEQLLTRYFDKHLAIHRSAGAFEFVTEQQEQVRERLDRTEAELGRLKATAGVISLADTMSAINESLRRGQQDLEMAEVDFAEQKARVKAISGFLGEVDARRSGEGHPGHGDIQQYNAVVTRLGVLRSEGLDLLSRYTAENRLVRMNRDQVQRLDRQRQELESRFPDLAALNTAGVSPTVTRTDLLSERARLAAIEARTIALRSQLETVRERAQQLGQVGPHIAQLERRKELEEQNFRYLEASLERARVDEALDPAKIPNISIVQRPSPAYTVESEIHKQVGMLAGGGAMLGLGLVFLFGYVFDRSLKRPIELRNKLGLNHMSAIPFVSRSALRPLMKDAPKPMLLTSGKPSKRKDAAAAALERFINPYCEGVCERLIHGFTIAGKTHKPKLVAVAGCHSGAGTSTIAAGLAAALSRTGDGKVLLVDMNTKRTDHRYYFGGTHVSSLGEVLEPGGKMLPAAENLYLATAGGSGAITAPANGDSSRPLPTRFHNLLPRLKTSEFDYVIFDMPPADDTSATLAIGGYVDKVFLVIEAEKTTRDAAKRTYSELDSMGADTAILVNKTRQYGPSWIGIES